MQHIIIAAVMVLIIFFNLYVGSERRTAEAFVGTTPTFERPSIPDPSEPIPAPPSHGMRFLGNFNGKSGTAILGSGFAESDIRAEEAKYQTELAILSAKKGMHVEVDKSGQLPVPHPPNLKRFEQNRHSATYTPIGDDNAFAFLSDML